jgi:competence protein ComEC
VGRPGWTAAAVAAALILGRAAVGTVVTIDAPPSDGAITGTTSGFEHQAVVISVSAPSNGQQRAVIELRPPEAPERVWASLPRYPQVTVGDVVQFGGTLEAAPNDSGFGAFLARSGVGYTTSARQLERLGDDGTPLAELEQARRAAAGAITSALPEPAAGLASAMSIGLRDLVARDIAADFRTTGLSHVVAISGWHIAMLGAVAGGLLGGIGRRPRAVLVLLAIVAYAIFAGASPSILRATAMAGVVLLARESGRRGTAAAGLSLTVAGMLLFDPATVADIGFQLSAAATAGLLVWGTRCRDWLESKLPKQTPGWLLESLGVSWAAQAATLPLVLFHFGTLSLVSPLANLLIGPLVAPAMLLTGVAFVCGLLIGIGIPALLFAPFALVGGAVIGAMIAIAHACAGLPFASLVLAAPLNVLLATACCVLLFLSLRRRASPPAKAASGITKREPATRRRSRTGLALGAAAATCLLVFGAVGARPDGRLRMTVLDVGQGDSILLEGPNGGRALVDTGPDPDRLVALLDARIPAWDRRLDLVVLTHPHEDHVAGVAAVLDRYRVREIVEPGMVGPGPGDAAYRRRLAELGRSSRVVAAGDVLWLDGMRIDIDWPLPGSVPLRPPDTGTAINNVSIVLDVKFGTRRFLLAGDVEQQIDPQLLAAGIARDGWPLDVLKVAHHGSRTATTDAFLEQMRPQVAVVSAGWGNPYGHPSPATVQRLRDGGARVFRTDLDGSVDISTDGQDLVANTGGGRPRPTAPRPTQPSGIGFCPVPPAVAWNGRRGRRTYNPEDEHPDALRSGADPARLEPA